MTPDPEDIGIPRTTFWAATIAAGFALVRVLLGREVKRHDTVISDHELRLRAIEGDRVGKADIMGIQTQLNEMRTRAEERHVEILDRMK